MKKVLIIAIVMIMALITIFTGCNVEGVVFAEKYDNEDLYLCGNQEYSDEINSIDISWKCGLIKFIESEDNKIVIEEENNLEDSKKVHSYLDNGTLYVRFWQSGKKDKVKAKDKHLTIKYPKCQDISIVGTSCILVADNINCNNLTIVKTSGEVVSENINCKNLDITTTSGAIAIGSINADNINIGTTSGSFECGNINTSILNFGATSGSFDAEINKASIISINGTSSSVNLKLGDFGSTITYQSTSGSFLCTKEHSTINGKTVIGDGSCMISVNTTSGSLNIRG